MRLEKKYFPYYVTVLVVMILVVGFFARNKKQQQQKEICWANIQSQINSINDLDSLVDYEIAEFQILVEQSLMVRVEMIKIAEDIRQHPDEPIGSKNLEF